MDPLTALVLVGMGIGVGWLAATVKFGGQIDTLMHRVATVSTKLDRAELELHRANQVLTRLGPSRTPRSDG